MINKARGMKREDIDKVRELAEKHFPDLEIPNFMNNFYCSFVITDEEDDIVIAGGLRPSAEILLITDKNMSDIKIVKALIEAKKASLYIGRKFGLNELVAFVKDNDIYARHLVKHGFYSRSNALAIKVPKWENQSETTS
jgi:hypothetical protein